MKWRTAGNLITDTVASFNNVDDRNECHTNISEGSAWRSHSVCSSVSRTVCTAKHPRYNFLPLQERILDIFNFDLCPNREHQSKRLVHLTSFSLLSLTLFATERPTLKSSISAILSLLCSSCLCTCVRIRARCVFAWMCAGAERMDPYPICTGH